MIGGVDIVSAAEFRLPVTDHIGIGKAVEHDIAALGGKRLGGGKADPPE